MDIADIATKALKAIANRTGKKLAKKGDAPEIEKASPIVMKNSKDEFFNAGFAMQEVMPESVTDKKYFLAGYRMDHEIKGVLDPLTVRAMWLDCKDGNGMIMVSADVIGLTGYDVSQIRASLSDFCKESGCKFINISCTHTHASIDTVGYWGKLLPPTSGVDKAYQAKLFEAIKNVCIQAYANRKEGKLYTGYVRVPETIKDGRSPYICNDRLNRLRFVPNDGSAETWFLNYGAHPNTMGGGCDKVSADYPYFLRERINREKAVNVLFSVSTIAATNIADMDTEDRFERCKKAGEILGKAALGIDNDEQLKPEITLVHQPFYAPADNYVLLLMALLKLCTSKTAPNKTSGTGVSLCSEMNYIKIGKQKILTLPGEMFTELAYGGYNNAEESATGKGAEINPTPLAEICNDPDLVIYGVSNDMAGYIVTPNESVLHPTQAYLSSTRDRFDRNHYHETNGMGEQMPQVVADVFADIIKRTEG